MVQFNNGNYTITIPTSGAHPQEEWMYAYDELVDLFQSANNYTF